MKMSNPDLRIGFPEAHGGSITAITSLAISMTLEKASCERYAIVKERFDAFLTPP
jgi:hypothetical protein